MENTKLISQYFRAPITSIYKIMKNSIILSIDSNLYSKSGSDIII